MLREDLRAKGNYFPLHHQLTFLTTETQCVYCDVGDASLYICRVKVNCLALKMALSSISAVFLDLFFNFKFYELELKAIGAGANSSWVI